MVIGDSMFMWRVKKRCPECEATFYNNCCTKCGYLKKGVKVKLDYSPVDEDLNVYSTDYSSMFTNENHLLVFILGLSYFAWAGHFILGILGVLGDYFIFYYSALFILSFLQKIGLPAPWLFYLLLIMTIFINRLCLKLDKIKYEHIKKKYKDKYKLHLNRLNGKKAVVLVYALWILLLIGFIVVYRYLNGTLFL